MGIETGISWAHSTCNFWRSCEEESPACDNCYARELAKRNPMVLGKWGSVAEGGTRVVAAEKYWLEPLKWNAAAEKAGERRRVFALSLGDFFEDWNGPMHDHTGEVLTICDNCLDRYDCEDRQPGCRQRPLTMQDVRNRAFEVIDQTPWLDWLLLTKRPQNIRRMWHPVAEHYSPAYVSGGEIIGPDCKVEMYRKNVWLGTTVENQEMADKRIPELLKCRDLSPVLWLSAEPLLGPIDLEKAHRTKELLPNFPAPTRVDWVIVGGESGSKARPMHPQWARDLRDQCASVDVTYHFKQWGTYLHVDDAIRAGLTTTYDGKYMPYDYSVGTPMLKVGTMKSGRLLDGVLHDAVPEVKHAST